MPDYGLGLRFSDIFLSKLRTIQAKKADQDQEKADSAENGTGFAEI